MNVYVVVEGVAEEKVYPFWIHLVNPALSRCWDVDGCTTDNFFLIAGMGNPQYFKRIGAAIEDVNEIETYDRLVVAVDSEAMGREEKAAQLGDFVEERHCRVETRIVVQHFCLEAWALGNCRVVRPEPENATLRSYQEFHDVRVKDPELLPDRPEEEMNRAQFAMKYLRLAVNEHFRNLSYSKGNPSVLMHPKYYEQLCLRLRETGHIVSFSSFLEAFS